MLSVFFGHMLWDGGVLPLGLASCVRGYPIALAEDLYSRWGIADLDFLVYEGMALGEGDTPCGPSGLSYLPY